MQPTLPSAQLLPLPKCSCPDRPYPASATHIFLRREVPQNVEWLPVIDRDLHAQGKHRADKARVPIGVDLIWF